ncbi:MAG: TRAP transporter small permease subunit, partial [Nevskiales bacterium]
VLIYFAVVVLRYFFNFGSIALQESVTYLHAMVFMLAAAYTLQNDGHVRVDIFYGRWPALRRAWVDMLGSLLLLLPFALSLMAFSWAYVGASWAQLETSAEPGGLPFVYLLKTLILIMGAQLALQAIAQALKAWQRIQEAG